MIYYKYNMPEGEKSVTEGTAAAAESGRPPLLKFKTADVIIEEALDQYLLNINTMSSEDALKILKDETGKGSPELRERVADAEKNAKINLAPREIKEAAVSIVSHTESQQDQKKMSDISAFLTAGSIVTAMGAAQIYLIKIAINLGWTIGNAGLKFFGKQLISIPSIIVQYLPGFGNPYVSLALTLSMMISAYRYRYGIKEAVSTIGTRVAASAASPPENVQREEGARLAEEFINSIIGKIRPENIKEMAEWFTGVTQDKFLEIIDDLKTKDLKIIWDKVLNGEYNPKTKHLVDAAGQLTDFGKDFYNVLDILEKNVNSGAYNMAVYGFAVDANSPRYGSKARYHPYGGAAKKNGGGGSSSRRRKSSRKSSRRTSRKPRNKSRTSRRKVVRKKTSKKRTLNKKSKKKI